MEMLVNDNNIYFSFKKISDEFKQKHRDQSFFGADFGVCTHICFPRQHEDHFFGKEAAQWFSSPDLVRKGVRTSQRLNLVVRVEKIL